MAAMLASATLGADASPLLCLSSLRPHRVGAAAARAANFLVPQILGINGIRIHALTLFHRPRATAMKPTHAAVLERRGPLNP